MQLQQKITMKVDTSAIEQKTATYEKQLRHNYSVIAKITEEIDTLDPDDKHCIKRKSDLDYKLYKMYDKTEYTKGEMNMSNGMTRREREVTDINEIIKILDTAKVLHLGLVDGDEPYVVPMNYGYTMENGKLTIYLHGAKRGRKIDVMRANPKVFFEAECNITPFEGDIACRYGIAYESIMGKGIAVFVEDVEEKKKALSILMKTQTGKDFEFEEKMTAFVSIIRIDVAEYTAKYRPMPATKP